MQGSVDRLLENEKALLLGESWSIFFGLPLSSSGYGIRDNAGVIQVKNAGGNWTSPIAESALQLGTISNNLSLLTLAVGTNSGTIAAHTLQLGTMSGTIGLNTLAIGTLTTTVGLNTLAIGTMSNTIATVNLNATGVVTFTGSVNLGSFSASVGGTISGEFLTIYDVNGNARKLAILS
jgi:hypothetical protein